MRLTIRHDQPSTPKTSQITSTEAKYTPNIEHNHPNPLDPSKLLMILIGIIIIIIIIVIIIIIIIIMVFVVVVILWYYSSIH